MDSDAIKCVTMFLSVVFYWNLISHKKDRTYRGAGERCAGNSIWV